MLLSLLITDVITVKEQVYVLVLCHLHPVAVYGDTELLQDEELLETDSELRREHGN